jgi:hypothetical protein
VKDDDGEEEDEDEELPEKKQNNLKELKIRNAYIYCTRAGTYLQHNRIYNTIYYLINTVLMHIIELNEYSKIGYSCNTNPAQIGHCSTCQPGNYYGWYYNIPSVLVQSRAAIEKDVFDLCFQYKIPDKVRAEDMIFTAPAIPGQRTERIIKKKDTRSIKNEAQSVISRRHTQELFYTMHPLEDPRIATSRYMLQNRHRFPVTLVSIIIITVLSIYYKMPTFCQMLVGITD